MDDELPDFAEDSESEDLAAARALLQSASDSLETDERVAAGLAAVEQALAGLDENADQEVLVVLLHAKCKYLEGSDRFQEALVVCDRELEVAAEGEEASAATARLAARAYLVRVGLLGRLERHVEALEEATAFQDFIESETESDWTRSLAAWAGSLRLRELIALDRLDDATGCWADLLKLYGSDPKPAIRSQVALAGALTTGYLYENKKRKLAIAVADDVIDSFQPSDDPRTRAAVAVAMTIKIGALRASGRLIATTKASSALLTFLGPEPEPEVARYMHHLQAGDRAVRLARWSERS